MKLENNKTYITTENIFKVWDCYNIHIRKDIKFQLLGSNHPNNKYRIIDKTHEKIFDIHRNLLEKYSKLLPDNNYSIF